MKVENEAGCAALRRAAGSLVGDSNDGGNDAMQAGSVAWISKIRPGHCAAYELTTHTQYYTHQIGGIGVANMGSLGISPFQV